MATTPNMSLVLPDASSTVGPTYAQLLTNIGGAFYTLDSHNHASGSGVQVPAAGLNINSDLPFNGFSATALNIAAFTTRSTNPSTNWSAFFKNNEFFIRDGVGNIVQITSSGSVAGATGSISSLTSPATASYSSVTKTFTWNQDANFRAHMDMASAVLHRGASAAENGITITPPAGLASSLTLTLPGAYGGAALMALVTNDAFGTLTFSSLVDGSTLENTGAVIRIKDAGITAAKIATGVVTGSASATATTANGGNLAVGTVGPANKVALGQAVASFNQSGLTSTTLADVTGASVSLTTTGRPIRIGIQGAAADTFNGIGIGNSAGALGQIHVSVLVDGTIVAQQSFVNAVSAGTQYFAAGLSFLATGIGSGAHTIKLQYKVAGGTSPSATFANLVLYAYET